MEYEVILSYLYLVYRWMQQEYIGTWKFHCSGQSLLILNVLYKLFAIMPKSTICIDVGFVSNDLVTTQIYCITHTPNVGFTILKQFPRAMFQSNYQQYPSGIDFKSHDLVTTQIYCITHTPNVGFTILKQFPHAMFQK